MKNSRLDVLNMTTLSESLEVWDSKALTKGLNHHSNVGADVLLLFVEFARGNIEVGGDFIRRGIRDCWCTRASNENGYPTVESVLHGNLECFQYRIFTVESSGTYCIKNITE